VKAGTRQQGGFVMKRSNGILAGLLGLLAVQVSFAVDVVKLTSIDKTDAFRFWSVYGFPDRMAAEAIHACLFDSDFGYRVSPSTVDQQPATAPVEFQIGQVSAATYEMPVGLIGFLLKKGESFSYWQWVIDNFTKPVGIESMTVRVVTTGDTISFEYYGNEYAIAQTADGRSVTITSSEPGQFLNRLNGSDPQTPALNLPTLFFSDRYVDFRIEVDCAIQLPVWWKERYTGVGIYISKPFDTPDLGIASVFTVGLTAATVDEGIVLDASTLVLPPGETHIVLPMFFSLSELQAAGVDPQSLRLYREETGMASWLLAGQPGNLDSSSGAFVSGPPTDVPGDFGVHVDEMHNSVVVWANIDNPGRYSVGARLVSQHDGVSQDALLPSILNLLLD
jgi:hypothetical protein